MYIYIYIKVYIYIYIYMKDTVPAAMDVPVRRIYKYKFKNIKKYNSFKQTHTYKVDYTSINNKQNNKT